MRSVLFGLVLCALNAAAQPGPYWAHGYGGAGDDRITAIAQGPGTAQFVCGTFSGTMFYPGGSVAAEGITDVFVACVDTGGVIQWMRTGGGPGPDRATDIAVDAQGRVSVTGQYSGTMQIAGSSLSSNGPSQDLFVARFAADGTGLWARSAGSPQNADIGQRVAVDAAGNTWVAGAFSHTAVFGGTILSSTIDPVQQAPGIDVFLAKYDAAGNLLWARSATCEREEEALGLAVDDEGNSWLAGRFSQQITFDVPHANNASNAAFLVKCDASGAEQAFARISGGTSVLVGDLCWHNDTLWMVGSQTGNNLVFAGSTVPIASAYAHSAFVLAFGPQAQLQAQRTVGNAAGIRGDAIHVRGGEVVVGGGFTCQADELSAWAGGNGLFLSWGAENVWVALLRRTDLATTHAQMLADHASIQLRGLLLDTAARVIAAGEYAQQLYLPSQEGLMRALPGDSLVQVGVGSVVEACGDTTYYDAVRINARGALDGFLARGIIRARKPLDIFQRDGCEKDLAFAFGITPVNQAECDAADLDLAFCGNGDLVASFNYLLGPAYTVGWNTGVTGADQPVQSTGTYIATGTIGDGCFSFTQQVLAGTCPGPALSGITDNQGLNEQDTLTVPVQVCEPEPIQLTAGPLSTASFYWSTYPADGSAVTTPVFTVPTSGFWALYSVGDNGCTSATPIQATYLPSEALGAVTIAQGISFPTDTDGNDTITLCDFQSIAVRLNGTITNNGVALMANGGFQVRDTVIALPGGLVDVGAFDLSAGERNVECPYSGTGWYRFRYTLGIGDGPCNDNYYGALLVDSIYVIGIPGSSSQVDIVGSIFLCDGDTVTLTAQANVPGSFQWEAENGGLVGASNAQMIQITVPGFVNVTFTPSDTSQCVNIDVDEHSVQYVSPPLIDMVPASGLVCPGDPVSLAVTGVSGTYTWYGPGGPLAFTTPTVQVLDGGTYFCVANTVEGCAYATALRTVSLYGTPFVDVLSPVLCAGGAVQVEVQPSQGAVITWESPLSGNSAFQTITAPGTYSCTVGLCGQVTPLTFTVQQSAADVAVLTPGPFTLCAGDSVQLSATPGLEGYAWQPGNQTTASAWVSAPAEYTVIGFNADGCTDTAGVVTVSAYAFSQELSAVGDTTCSGDTLFFTGSAGGPITWYADPGLQQPLGSGASLAVVLPEGDQVIYAVQEEGGCTSEPLPVPALVYEAGVIPTVVGDTILCQGDALLLSASPGTDIEWVTPIGTLAGPVLFILYAIADLTGTWYVSGDLGECSTGTAVVNVLVSAPQVDLVDPGPVALCPGSNAVLEATPGMATYTWQPGGAEGPTLAVDSAGLYAVIGTDAVGCVDTSAVVEVYDFAYASPLSASTASTCAGDTAQVSATGSGIISWYADAALEELLGSGVALAIPSAQAGDSVFVVQEEGPCISGALGIALQVAPAPPAPAVEGDTVLCVGDDLALSVSAVYATTWSTPSGPFSGAEVQVPAVGLDAAGTYSVQYMDSLCTGPVATVLVSVAIPGTVDLGADTAICAEDLLLLAVNDWVNVLWSNGSDGPAVQAGPGTWWVQVSDGLGCVAGDTVLIAEADCLVPVGNTFTPNGDGVNDVLTLSDPGGRMLTFNVYNRWGQLVFQRSAQVVQWDGRSGTTAEVLPTGVYYYVLERPRADGSTEGRTGYIQLIR